MKCLTNFTLAGLRTDCNPNLAGIETIYIGYYGDFAVSADTSAHTISNIEAATGASTGKLYEYEFAKQTGSLTSTLTKDEANGTRYFSTVVVLSFNKLEAAKHLEIQALSAERLVAVVKDSNQKFWYVGFDSYLSATEANAQTGQSYDDKSGYDITMSQQSAYLPFEIDYDTFKSLIDSSN